MHTLKPLVCDQGLFLSSTAFFKCEILKSVMGTHFKFYFILIFLLGINKFVSAETVLSQTVGSVGDDIVSSREVKVQATIERILFPVKEKGASPVENKTKEKKGTKQKSVRRNELFELSPKDLSFQNELSSTLLEIVIQKEAESFKVAQPTDSELKEAVQKVEKAVGGHSYWNGLEVGAKELESVLKRKLTAKKFIKIKTDLMTALVTDQDALNYYEKNRLKFGQLPFSNFKENIKTFLAQQQMEERLKTLFEVIKRKYKVRNYLVEGRAVH